MLPDGGEFGGAECFGAGCGRDGCGGDGRGYVVGLPSGGAEIIRQRFAFLREAGSQEGCKRAGIDAELEVMRVEDPAENGGVDLGRRRECAGRQGKQLFHVAVELDGDREQAVVAGAGLGCDAVGDFALDHKDGAVDSLFVGCEVQQDVRGEVVGQVADDEQLFVRPGERREIDIEDVAFDDFDIALRCEAVAEAWGQVAVEFDGDEAFGVRGEQFGDGGFAGADFDDGAAGDVAEGIDNALASRGADEEVLAELGFVAGGNGVLLG